MSIEVLKEYQDVLSLVYRKEPIIFITGSAGTGKSTLISWLESKIGNVVLAAPTGIAAMNIGGKTTNSMFMIPPNTINDPEELKDNVSSSVLKTANVVIIDEVSMVTSNMVDCINKRLQQFRRNRKLFGGCTVIFVGDLFQLPPVIVGEAMLEYNKIYKSPFFFDAHCLEGHHISTIDLQVVRRQANPQFINILRDIRKGENLDDAVEQYNDIVNISTTAPEGSVILTTVNRVADTYNKAKLASLKTEEETYIGEITGTFQDERMTVPVFLDLKVGAQVIVTKNMNECVYNGLVGKVVSLLPNLIIIKDSFDNEHQIKRNVWENVSFKVINGKIERTVIGTYRQFPLKLGYAMTIHKSQGQTLSSVYIDVSAGAFATGQMYVALSRCKTIEGITMSRPLSKHDIFVDERVVDYYTKAEEFV